MRDWAADLVDRGQVREQHRVRAQDEAAPEEERPIVDRHERLANGDEQASVRASSSRHGFPQCHDRYNADDTDDDDSSFRQTAAHVTQRDAVVLPRDDRVQRDRGADERNDKHDLEECTHQHLSVGALPAAVRRVDPPITGHVFRLASAPDSAI
jgi:hypothetical protein